MKSEIGTSTPRSVSVKLNTGRVDLKSVFTALANVVPGVSKLMLEQERSHLSIEVREQEWSGYIKVNAELEQRFVPNADGSLRCILELRELRLEVNEFYKLGDAA